MSWDDVVEPKKKKKEEYRGAPGWRRCSPRH
jgi:hypothetical protein